MIFEQPTGLTEAVRTLIAKDLLPTDMTSEEIRGLDRVFRNQSLFSARTLNEYLLQLYKDRITNILQPDRQTGGQSALTPRATYTPAYVREEITKFLKSIGYRAEEGKEGTIEDLAARQRIDLVVETNRDMALGQGWWMEGQQKAILDQWPAQELFRAEARAVPRDWLYRFRLAGEKTGAIGEGWTITPDLRMVALKNHEIWSELGSSENFDDGLDQPWPPFAFRSGMWVRDITRREAVDAGIMDEGEEVQPQSLEEALAA